jgi:hypothetical protein
MHDQGAAPEALASADACATMPVHAWLARLAFTFLMLYTIAIIFHAVCIDCLDLPIRIENLYLWCCTN